MKRLISKLLFKKKIDDIMCLHDTAKEEVEHARSREEKQYWVGQRIAYDRAARILRGDTNWRFESLLDKP